MSRSIDEFWQWWPGARGRLQAAIESRKWPENDALVEEVTRRVHALDERLAWLLCPGQRARHAFCVSPAGDPTLRILTEKWRAAAPPPDETWEYHPARPATPGVAMMLGDVVVEPQALRVSFAVDPARERIDLKLYHPRLGDLPAEMHDAVALIGLTNALGEDGVERWIGGLEVTTEEPDGALPLEALDRAVAALAQTATGEKFQLLEGEDDQGQPVFVAINQALKRIDHVLCDYHVEVILHVDELAMADAREDEILARLGDAAVFVGHETLPGRRYLHFFAAESARPAFAELGLEVTWEHDPLWQTLHRWEPSA